MKPQKNGNYFFDPSFVQRGQHVYGSTSGTHPARSAAVRTSANTDFAILKTFKISEIKRVDFRAEFFNIFNHTQFFNPDGNFSDGPQFGQVNQARDPRLMQFALKFFF